MFHYTSCSCASVDKSYKKISLKTKVFSFVRSLRPVHQLPTYNLRIGDGNALISSPRPSHDDDGNNIGTQMRNAHYII